jgi:hypothetical protein
VPQNACAINRHSAEACHAIGFAHRDAAFGVQAIPASLTAFLAARDNTNRR